MERHSGTPKTGGRKAGTPNKRSVHLQDALDESGLEPIALLCELTPSLPPREQAGILMNLLPYLYPRHKSIEIATPNEEPKFLTLVDMMKHIARRQAILGHANILLTVNLYGQI